MTSDEMMQHLWIIGLRRSGTTAIWRMFRELENFTCYDEPFNPKLETHLPEPHRKGTWDEFIDLWNRDRDIFRSKLTTIDLDNEMSMSVSEGELDYLHYLAQTPSIIDFTRLNFKISTLIKAFPKAVILFLYRSPIAFATSHIINSENRKFLRQFYYRTMFFSRGIGFDSWGLERNLQSKGFPELVEACDIIPSKPIGKLKSVEKLLLLWLVARRHSQKVIAENVTSKVFAASYEDIIDGKSDGLIQATAALGIKLDSLETDHFHDYTLGYHHTDPVWQVLMGNAGFSGEEIQTYVR